MTNQPDQRPAWEKKIDEYKFCCNGDYCFGHEDDKEDMKQIIRQVEAQAVAAERERISDLFMLPEVYTASCLKHVACRDCVNKIADKVIKLNTIISQLNHDE